MIKKKLKWGKVLQEKSEFFCTVTASFSRATCSLDIIFKQQKKAILTNISLHRLYSPDYFEHFTHT